MKKIVLFVICLLSISGCKENNASTSLNSDLSSNFSIVESKSEVSSTSSIEDYSSIKEELAEKYPLYVEPTNINNFDFLHSYNHIIFLWKIENREWRCGFKPFPYGNFIDMDKIEEMQNEYSCTLETFALILRLFYDITDPYFDLMEITYPASKNDISQAKYVTNKELYDSLGLKASYVRNVLREAEYL